MSDFRIAVVPAMLALQAVLAFWADSGEKRPAAPAVAAFPQSLGEWGLTSEIPAEAYGVQLGADRVFQRMYSKASDGSSAEIFVAWFQSQRSGMVQPHSPLICIPGNGWTIDAKQKTTTATAAGTLPATQLTVSRSGQSLTVLYWYQTSFRATPDEWASKFWLAFDIFREKRTDIAMVRIVGLGGGATAAVNFARDAYPEVVRWLAPPQPADRAAGELR